MNDKALTLFIPVWGQKHLTMLETYCLPSLMLPGNLPALGLEQIYVECVGIQPEREAVLGAIKRGLGFIGLPVEFHLHGGSTAQDPTVLMPDIIRRCRERGTLMFVAMPDTIYGNGSVSNMFNYAKGKNVVVAAAHVRVNEDLFLPNFPHWKLWPQNRDFVRAAFRVGAFNICDTNKDNVASVGGVAWTKVNDNMKLVLHYLPTSYLVRWSADDLAYWNTRPGWGVWDHQWPSRLIAQRRWRVMGSSSAFFAIELEDATRSNTMKPIPGSVGNELYNGRDPHNDVAGCFLIDYTE